MINKSNVISMQNYFEEEFLTLERKKLFANRPEYIGSAGMLKEDGDYHVVERSNQSKVLIRSAGEIQLLDNICSHRQALILKGFGQVKKMTCPIHQWRYDLEGQCENTPMMTCDKSKLHLKHYPTNTWNGFIFSGETNFGDSMREMPFLADFDFTGYEYSRTVTETTNMNWKHLVDAFTEDYHVPFMHPGFSSTIIADSLTRFNFQDFTAQSFLTRDMEFLRKCKTTPAYRAWIDILLQVYPKDLPKYGGILVLYYPNIMIEWYPFSVIVTTLHPVSAQKTICHLDFFHESKILQKFPELGKIAEETFLETAAEDVILCERIEEGRRALYEQKREMDGPLQPHLEGGLDVFRNYYLEAMK